MSCCCCVLKDTCCILKYLWCCSFPAPLNPTSFTIRSSICILVSVHTSIPASERITNCNSHCFTFDRIKSCFISCRCFLWARIRYNILLTRCLNSCFSCDIPYWNCSCDCRFSISHSTCTNRSSIRRIKCYNRAIFYPVMNIYNNCCIWKFCLTSQIRFNRWSFWFNNNGYLWIRFCY